MDRARSTGEGQAWNEDCVILLKLSLSVSLSVSVSLSLPTLLCVVTFCNSIVSLSTSIVILRANSKHVHSNFVDFYGHLTFTVRGY